MRLLIIACITTYAFAIHIERTLDRISKDINRHKLSSTLANTVTFISAANTNPTSSPLASLRTTASPFVSISSLPQESTQQLYTAPESFDESNRMFTLPTSFSGDSREYIYFGYFSEPISYHDQIIRNRLEGPYITEEGLYIYRRRMIDF